MDTPSKRLTRMTQIVSSRLAARETDEASLVAVVSGFDDAELTSLLTDASALRAETDAVITAASGVIAKRSERALGYAGLAQREGHRTPVAMVQHLTGATRAEATRQVRLGEALGEADAAARALESDGDEAPLDATGPADAGDAAVAAVEVPWFEPVTSAVTSHLISAEVGAAILRGLGTPDEHVTAEQLRAAAVDLLGDVTGDVTGVDVDEAGKRARWARDAIDPVGVEDRARQRYDARTWKFGKDHTTGAETAWVKFDDDSAAWLHSILDAALAPRRGGPRFLDPAAQARAQALTEDPRTNDQLVFDTIVDTLRTGALADPATVFGTRQPGVRVVITTENLDTRDNAGNLTGCGFYESTGHTVPGAVIERTLCNTGAVPVTVDAFGQPLDVGREQRCFTPKQRTALRIRDGGCRWPDCARTPENCEAHHLNPWAAEHGRTDIADGILLCRHHHMLLHNNHWRITRNGATYWLIPPASIDADQHPILLRTKSPLRYPARTEASGQTDAGQTAGDNGRAVPITAGRASPPGATSNTVAIADTG